MIEADLALAVLVENALDAGRLGEELLDRRDISGALDIDMRELVIGDGEGA